MVGTEKQVAYADDIRHRFANRIAAEVVRLLGSPQPGLPPAAQGLAQTIAARPGECMWHLDLLADLFGETGGSATESWVRALRQVADILRCLDAVWWIEKRSDLENALLRDFARRQIGMV